MIGIAAQSGGHEGRCEDAKRKWAVERRASISSPSYDYPNVFWLKKQGSSEGRGLHDDFMITAK